MSDSTITDSCACGAKFSANNSHASYSDAQHVRWLVAHTICREKSLPAPPPEATAPILPLSPEGER